MKKFFAFVTVALMSISMFAENITVAQAIEIGKKLAAKAETAEEYTVEGYVGKAYTFNSTLKTQTFYMTDDANADSEANFDFQAYLCKLDKAVTTGTKVTVTGKISNHISAKGGQTIRIKSGKGATDGGETPPVPIGDALTVAQAMAIAGALAQGAATTEEYEVVGYVTGYAGKNEDGGWAQYGNQNFWIVDDKSSTATSTADGALQVYQGKAEEKVLIGDRIKVKATLSNYNGTLETSKGGVVTFVEKVPRGDEPPTPVDSADVTFLPADFEGQGQAATLETPGGSVTQTKNGVTVSADNAYGHNLALRVYKGANLSIVSETEQIGRIVFQFYSTYTGNLDTEVVVNAKEWTVTLGSQARIEKLQIYFGTAEQKPKPEVEAISVAEAMAIGEAIEGSGKTSEKYSVRGYVASAKGFGEKYEGAQTFYMSDDPTATRGDFTAYNCKVEAPGVGVGDLVVVTGLIQKYVYDSGDYVIEITSGDVTIESKQAIENIVLTEQAQKVLIDGVIYIVRDGKMFNLQGAQVR